MPRPRAQTILSRLVRLASTSDPGLGRLRMASRVTLTLALVVGALLGVHALAPLPPAAYGIAMITAMQGALAVREASARAQLRTRLAAGLAAFAVAVLAVVLEPVPRLADAFFVALVFAAVYARRYGARWNAVGMFAFMCYFISVYLHPSAGDLPALAAAIAVSGAIAHLVRNAVLPEHADEEFRRTIRALGRRLDALGSTVAVGEAAGWTPPARREAIERQAKLGDAILAAEGYLPAEALAGAEDGRAMGDLAVALFDLHLACETLLVAHLADRPADAAEDEARRAAAARRLAEARGLVERLAAEAPPEAFTRAPPPPSSAPSTAPADAWIRDPQLRLAIQVSLAAGLAMAGGLLLSKTRFFWAILTAFLVFTNTQSRGDTMLRAANRALGTMIGIVVGIGLAVLVHGQFALSVGLSAVFVFAGFYLLQISYGAMTFFVTLVVSLLYGLIGQFSPELLVLRLEETLIGAAAGAFVAFAVLPQRTSTAAGGAADALLGTLDDLLAAAAMRLDGGGGPSLLALSRRLDHRYAALAAVARPLGQHWQLVRRPGPLRIALLRFMAMAYWARVLARALTVSAVDDAARDPLRRSIRTLRDALARERRPDVLLSVRASEPGLAARDRMARHDAPGDDPLFALDVLTHIVGSLAAKTPASARADAAAGPAPNA